MLLTDPLDAYALTLLTVIYRGSDRGRADWPLWQWVRQSAARAGVGDPDAVFARLPQWGLHYRPVWVKSGFTPSAGDPVALTVHGLARVGDVARVGAFLGALTEGCRLVAEHVPSPHTLTENSVTIPALAELTTARSGYPMDPELLRAMLLLEPATWLGHTDHAGSSRPSTWDLTSPTQLHHFAGVSGVEDYLERLDLHLVGTPAREMATHTAPEPLALLDALDHLDAEWQIRTNTRLVTVQRTLGVGTLSQPVSTSAGFDAACGALADTIASFTPGWTGAKVDGTLNQLERRLSELLTDSAALDRSVTGGVRVLRDVVAIRNSTTHSGSGPYLKAQRARRNLGLPIGTANWEADWNQLRRATIDGLRLLRTEIAASGSPTP